MSESIKSLIHDRIVQRKRFFSIEITPKPDSIIDIATEFKDHSLPLFVSITWIGDTNQKHLNMKESPALRTGFELSRTLPVLMHLTCFALSESQLGVMVENFRNIFPLKGDSAYKPSDDQKYKCCTDLIQAIAQRKQRQSTIVVAGYPPKTVEDLNKEDFLHRLDILKKKFDLGIDGVITQIVYDPVCFIKYLDKCQEYGIVGKPILPGIFVPSSYGCFKRMTELTETVPVETSRKFEEFKGNEVEFRKFAVKSTVELITRLFTDERVAGVHFFTMNNLDLIKEVVLELGIE